MAKDDKDKPTGKVRSQLAELSATGGLGQRAPAHLVNPDGSVVE